MLGLTCISTNRNPCIIPLVAVPILVYTETVMGLILFSTALYDQIRGSRVLDRPTGFRMLITKKIVFSLLFPDVSSS